MTKKEMLAILADADDDSLIQLDATIPENPIGDAFDLELVIVDADEPPPYVLLRAVRQVRIRDADLTD